MRKETAIEIINPTEEKNLKVPKGMLIAGKNVYFSRDSYKTGLNNHGLVVGTSGSGKTRYIVIPNILLAEGSYLVSDPKGNLYKKLAPYLEAKGYQVKKVTFIPTFMGLTPPTSTLIRLSTARRHRIFKDLPIPLSMHWKGRRERKITGIRFGMKRQSFYSAV